MHIMQLIDLLVSDINVITMSDNWICFSITESENGQKNPINLVP